MEHTADPRMLLLSFQRALLGAVHPQLRQASIEADAELQVVRLRFEYDGAPEEIARESCSYAATEVIADFAPPWGLDEQYVLAPGSSPLAPLAHVAYRRWEATNDA